MPAALIARLQAYLDPLILLSFSLIFLPLTLFTHPLLLLTSPSEFRSKWFANFWKLLGPKMAASPEQAEHVEELLSRSHGTVLELGPGSGDQMYHFKTAAKKINRLYGAEPNVNLHPMLVQKANENGLQGKYVALEAGAEPNSLLPALKKAGVLPASGTGLPDNGVFDTVIAVKSMCSAKQSEMASTLAVIQALLKPGGEFIFFEHVENHTDALTKAYVWMLGWVWPLAMGGCHLNSKIDRVALGMSGWVPSVQTTTEFKGYNCFRYVKGVCTKK